MKLGRCVVGLNAGQFQSKDGLGIGTQGIIAAVARKLKKLEVVTA